MKKVLTYLIVAIALLFIILSSSYVYRIDNKENTIDSLEVVDGILSEEKVIVFTAIKDNLNKIKLNIDYNSAYDNDQEIRIKVENQDQIIKEDKISLNKLETYKSIYIELNKIKDSNNKEYTITITPIDDVDCTVKSMDIMYYKKYHTIVYMGLIVFVTLVTFILLKLLLKDKNIKIEKWYLILSILVYGMYLIVFPMFTPHDELYHWGRAYEISEGHLTSEIHNNQALTEVPRGVASIYPTEYLDIKYGSSINGIHEKIIKGDNILFDMKTVSVYSPIQYIPQTIGIIISRIFTNRTLLMAYAARLMNAILSILLMYFAIKLIPFGKRVLFTIGFIPIAIEGFTSMSADAITISVSLLFISYILYLKTNKDIKVLNKKHYALLLIMGIVLALCKIVYIPLIFLLLLLPKEKFNDKKHRLLFVLSILGISVVLNLCWLRIASGYLKLYETTGSQVISVLKHPINFIQVFLYTFMSKNDLYLYGMLGYDMGWGDVIHPYSIIIFVLMIILSLNALSDKDMKRIINKKEIIIITLIVLLIIGLIFASLYVQFTPPGYRIIFGVQGRYFLPFLPLIMMVISKINMEYKGKLNLDMITIIACLLLNISVILTIFERFI